MDKREDAPTKAEKEKDGLTPAEKNDLRHAKIFEERRKENARRKLASEIKAEADEEKREKDDKKFRAEKDAILKADLDEVKGTKLTKKALTKMEDKADEIKGIKKAPEVVPNPVNKPEPKGKGRDTEIIAKK